MAFDKPVIVLDNGSYNIKAGFSCDNHPVSIFRTVVGRPKYLNGSYGRENYDVFIGDDAMARIEDFELFSPVVNGKIVHWDNMERIWHHCFYRELKAAPEDRCVMLGCAAKTTMQEKIKCSEIFFETLNCPGVCIQPQAVLSLYGSGVTTGVSIDLGCDSTDINPIYEGGLIKYAHMQTNLSGRQITDFIKQKLTDKNLNFGLKTDEVIEDIKKHMYLTKHVVFDNKETYIKKYTLPSGESIDVSDESFMPAEMIFQPNLVAGRKTGFLPLHEAFVTSTLKCDADLRTDLYEAVVPWGGLATIPGLNERLSHEIEELIRKPCNVLTTTEPYTVAWLGGATFAGMRDAKKIWVTKKQYEDHGVKIIRNRFL